MLGADRPPDTMPVSELVSELGQVLPLRERAEFRAALCCKVLTHEPASGYPGIPAGLFHEDPALFLRVCIDQVQRHLDLQPVDLIGQSFNPRKLRRFRPTVPAGKDALLLCHAARGTASSAPPICGTIGRMPSRFWWHPGPPWKIAGLRERRGVKADALASRPTQLLRRDAVPVQCPRQPDQLAPFPIEHHRIRHS